MKYLLIILTFFIISCKSQGNEIQHKNKSMENEITFGGGCFWCIESCFSQLKGIKSVVSGYSGGNTENPTYPEVCTGKTNHAEVVHITYDATKISYNQLLDVFFFLHDPTQLNRQGEDIGTQYRSVVFYNSEAEKLKIDEKIKTINSSGKYTDKVVTQVVHFQKFWPAESYHQGYYIANPDQPYCSAVVGPKIKKFKEHFQPLGLIHLTQ